MIILIMNIILNLLVVKNNHHTLLRIANHLKSNYQTRASSIHS